MRLFNQTFVDGKEVIFPDNWHTGRTYIEMFEETRKSLPWLVAAKVLQVTVAFLWILLLYTIGNGLLEIYKVWKLPQQSLKRKEYRKVLRSQSLFSILFVSISLIILTAVLTYKHEWILWALLQAAGIWVGVLAVRRAWFLLCQRK